MEYTPEEAEKMLAERIAEYPQIQAVLDRSDFDETIRGVLAFVAADQELFPIVRNELLVILAFYAPITEFAQNISESTELSVEISTKIASLLDTLLLSDIRNDLLAFAALWNAELAKSIALTDTDIDLKERLELRPKGVERDTNTPERTPVPKAPASGELMKDGEVTLADMKIIATPGKEGAMDTKKPLTKEEILGALAPRRTMASDIALVKGETLGQHPAQTPVIEHLKENIPSTPPAPPESNGKPRDPNAPVVGYDAL